jgi:hypothetical protein
MNRAPAPNDFWWSRHQKECGGTFHKVSEPENYRTKGKAKNKQNTGNTEKQQKRGESDIKTLLEHGKASKTPKKEKDDEASNSSEVVDLT